MDDPTTHAAGHAAAGTGDHPPRNPRPGPATTNRTTANRTATKRPTPSRTTPVDAAIEVSGVTKRFRDTTALAGVDLRVEHGEVVGLLGPNGAGKSTLVAALVGLRRPDAGTIRVLGLDPARDRQALRRRVGVQPQGAVFHDALTVRELLVLHIAFHDAPYPLDELLDLVDLTAKAGTRVERLSGGQHQRLALAIALAGRPGVLVLDELSTGLDPGARARIRTRIERIRDDGTTILLVSHDMEEVERLCDRIVLLDDGRVIADASPTALVDACRAEHPGVTTLDGAFLALTGSAPAPDTDPEDE